MRRIAVCILLAVAGCSSSGLPAGVDGGSHDLAGGGGGDGGGDGGGGDGGAGACGVSCAAPFVCCGNQCVNLQNDPFHCNGCNGVCGGSNPYCQNGSCQPVPCNGVACFTGFCCGDGCCSDGQLCCLVQGPGPSMGPICFTPTADQPTCPRGCPLCQ